MNKFSNFQSSNNKNLNEIKIYSIYTIGGQECKKFGVNSRKYNIFVFIQSLVRKSYNKNVCINHTSAENHWVINFFVHFFQVSGNNVHYTYEISIRSFKDGGDNLYLHKTNWVGTSFQVENITTLGERKRTLNKVHNLDSGWWSSTTSRVYREAN